VEYRSLFVGLRVQCSPEMLSNLDKIHTRLVANCQKTSWVDAVDYHMTLAFLGAVRVSEARRYFENGLAAMGIHPTLELDFGSLETFDSNKLPGRILFAAPKPDPRLALIGKAFQLPTEPKTVFHLTLNRAKNKSDGEWIVKNLAGKQRLGMGTIHAISLMANDGSEHYVDVEQMPLSGVELAVLPIAYTNFSWTCRN
jgi:2'-5' RNA ligase